MNRISVNEIGDNTAELAQALKVNKSLQILNLAYEPNIEYFFLIE